MATDLQRAYEALTAKQNNYAALWNYYDGKQPLVYSTERLRTIFSNVNASFTQNWCAVIVDATLDRLNLESFTVENDDTATNTLNTLWTATGMDLDDRDAHLATLVTGEAFVIAWSDGTQIHAFYNDPRLCHAFYDPTNPRELSLVAKWWVSEDDEKRHISLYYADHLENYVSKGKAVNVSSPDSFEPDVPDTEPNPWGRIPVFHLRPERRVIKGELTDSIRDLQDATNKLFADMMVAAEFGAYKQRWIISNAGNLGQLKNAPNEIWDIPAGDGQGQQTTVGEFSATDLANYLDAMDKLASSMAIISRTPKHYFFNQGGDPSGEALIAMEAPLNKKCERLIDIMQSAWRQVAAFVLELAGVTVDPANITPNFDDPTTVQPLTQAQIRQANVAAGMPLVTQLRDEGWSADQLDEMEADKDAAASSQQASLASALVDAQRRMDQGIPGQAPGQQQGA